MRKLQQHNMKNITIQYGSGNQISKNIDGELTVGQAITQFRNVLGYGQNVEGHLDGIPQGNDISLEDGDVLSIHDKACSKASGFTTDIHANGGVTVKFSYGTGNTVTHTFPEGTTLDQALKDPAVSAALGYGRNVEGHVGGVPQPAQTTLQANDEVAVHDKACSKASR